MLLPPGGPPQSLPNSPLAPLFFGLLDLFFFFGMVFVAANCSMVHSFEKIIILNLTLATII
jgi:hypothetical protein